MAVTKSKGTLGEAMVMADALRRGYKVALPVGEDWRFDLIVLRHGKLERVQCKYVESDGEVIAVPCSSRAATKLIRSYTPDEIDWLAVYDKTTDKCYYISAEEILKKGRSQINLRIAKPVNNQPNYNRASDFLVW